jgi:hypothetical protein
MRNNAVDGDDDQANERVNDASQQEEDGTGRALIYAPRD